jgi:hypothetical protein
MGTRIGQRADDLEELHDRAGPAVEYQQGHGVGLGRAGMDEVDPLAIDGGGELGVPVEPGLPGPPVVPVGPVAGQLLQVPEGHAAGPAHAGQLVRPAGPGQPLAQVVQLGLGDLDAERADLTVVHAGTLPAGGEIRSRPRGGPSPTV